MLRNCESATHLTLEYLLITVVNLCTMTQQKLDHRVIILHGSNGQWCDALQHSNQKAHHHHAHACLPETSVSTLHHKYAEAFLRLHQERKKILSTPSSMCKSVQAWLVDNSSHFACSDYTHKQWFTCGLAALTSALFASRSATMPV